MNITIKGFMKKEFAQALRDPRMRIFLFAAPVIQLLVLGYAVSNEIKNVKLAAQYSLHDQLAAKIVEHCRNTESFKVVNGFGQDPMFLIESGKADAVLIAPVQGLKESLLQGNGELQLLIDATNVFRARSIEQYMQGIVMQTVQAECPDIVTSPSMRLDTRVLYNPSMNTSFYLVPGVMALLACILTVIMTSMSLVRERELGTFETLVSAPVSNWEILMGKTLPFVILGMGQMFIIMLAALLLFGLPMEGAWWKLFLGILVYVCSTISIGIFISTISRNQQQAMMGSFMFVFPGLLLSGMMFPIENMPKFLMVFAYLNPIKYFLTLLRNILLKGGNDLVFWSNCGVLILMALIMMGLSFNRFKQTLN